MTDDRFTLRLRLAVVMAVYCATMTIVLVATRTVPAGGTAWLLSEGPMLMVILWLCRDAQQKRIGAVTDLGFFLVVFWPVVIPWYVFKTRGRSGWKLLLGLFVLMFPAPLTGALLYLAGLS